MALSEIVRGSALKGFEARPLKVKIFSFRHAFFTLKNADSPPKCKDQFFFFIQTMLCRGPAPYKPALSNKPRNVL